MAAQHAGVAKPQIDPGKIEVKKAEGGDGRTVAEVYAQRKALSGKSVAVRGKVVKVMNGIMGRNFIHLRDGSGSPEKGDNDLVVTSNEQAANGDTVLVKGKVAADRDFGSGYTYAVIVEEAKIAKDAK